MKQKKGKGCVHASVRDVMSASGSTIYGRHCLHCGMQWSFDRCDTCGNRFEQPAKNDRKKARCPGCVAKAKAGVTKTARVQDGGMVPSSGDTSGGLPHPGGRE